MLSFYTQQNVLFEQSVVRKYLRFVLTCLLFTLISFELYRVLTAIIVFSSTAFALFSRIHFGPITRNSDIGLTESLPMTLWKKRKAENE